jgi:hypothetical protein
LPVSGGNWSFPTYPEGIAVPDGTAPPSVNFRVITPSYVETMAIPLIKGRTFSATDRADGARVALVNRAFVELIGTRWIQSLLFGVSPHDPLAIAGGGLVLGAVGFIATLLPAWRATRIDPAAVLRAEG